MRQQLGLKYILCICDGCGSITKQEHFEAACQIKQLYEKSDFIGRFLDDRDDPNVIAMYRFQIPITLISGKKAFAYISTKYQKNSPCLNQQGRATAALRA